MRRILCFALLLLTVGYVAAQEKNNIIPIAALADSIKAQAKPVLILLTTDWCKYCKIQKVQLEKNHDFQAARNNFYFVEFNAETQDSILFNEKVYHYKSSGLSTGIHELAVELGNQKQGISYPLWIILDKDYQILLRRNGLLSGQQIQEIVKAISKP
jgi:thioredoxin-related protein